LFPYSLFPIPYSLFAFLFSASCLLLLTAETISAADAKVLKTLPQFLDAHGRSALSPSLYERDAYQAYLRKHPKEQSGLRLAVQWKAAGVDWSKLKLRAELRGITGNTPHIYTREIPVKKSGLFGNWSEFKMTGEDFRQFGELAAWRVTLWEGDKPLAEQQSFLWSGVGPSAP
jgi:hypothetical protein